MRKGFILLMAFSLVYILIAPSATFAGGSANCVTLYSKPDGKGSHKRVCGNRDDLSKIGWDNKTRSIKVEDVTIYLYFDKKYKNYYVGGQPHYSFNVEPGISSFKFNTMEA
ncbi:beta/gamma crystallin-related protein [Shimazuella kribbensis]|uniref:beta/gamma crystallin-related protein n=1 Tax=Shimazuella kribbensis TaxID=139808 RepID=UPI0003FC6740|nr:beta/gamma crystallin-related protein [Shimazuella kribbensis]